MSRFRAVLALLLAGSLTLTLPVQSSAYPALQVQKGSGSTLVLEDGTPIKLRLGRTISSADETVGDQIDLEVIEELQIDNVIVIPKGSIALATVTSAQAKRRMARGGKLDINIDTVRLANGQKAALRAVKNTKGGGHTGAMTGAIVATSLVLWPAAPLFLLMHGKDVTIPKGTPITAYIEGNMNLDARAFRAVPGSGAATEGMAVAAASEVNASSAVAITSTPAGAEISVDGSFMGNTPSSISLAAGEHQVLVRKSGYQDWERKIRLSSGAVTLTAELLQGSSVPSVASVSAPKTEVSGSRTADVKTDATNPAPTDGPGSIAATPSTTQIALRRRVTQSPAETQSRAEIQTRTSVGWIGASAKRDEKGQLAITEVIPNGPAARAGLRPGDFITALNGEPVTSGDKFDISIAASAPGSKIQLGYMRSAWVREATITVGAEQ